MVGAQVREWRTRRRLTQLELALDAGISARHLSFVETGRSKPGRDLLMRILEELDVPYRERNQLLLAAGHAPAFPERSLGDPELAPVRDALDLILSRHEPYPAIAIDRGWNLVAANGAVTALVAELDIDPALLEPPVNAVRVGLHPRLAPLIPDLPAWRAYLRERIERQYATSGGEDLLDLIEELTDDGDVSSSALAANGFLGPLRVRRPDGVELAFFGMFAIFDTPFEVTTSELAIELLFPADAATAVHFGARRSS
ncbi:MAG TPA: helix-turn-helix transcriptional regulator [Solirubrobacteraceae bacterium]|nr:helix-turn-helix transcriptional regulator [Solirubrobacteraceae bacterium]